MRLKCSDFYEGGGAIVKILISQCESEEFKFSHLQPKLPNSPNNLMLNKGKL